MDNEPDWVAIQLATRGEVLAIYPDYAKLDRLNVDVIASQQGPQAETDVEVYAPMDEEFNENPVTGSLNVSLAQWLIGTGVIPGCYMASRGTALDRRGWTSVKWIGGDIWIDGEVQPDISGQVVF